MLHELAGSVSESVCKIQNINETSKKEEIAYGMELLLSAVITFAVVMVISLAIGRLLECVVFMAFFMPLRIFAGGYHARTHIKCFMVLIVDLLVGLILLHTSDLFMFVFSIVSVILSIVVITLLSPVVDINYPLSKRQVKRSRKRSLWVLSIEILIIVIMMLFSMKMLYFCASYGLFSVSVATFIAKIKK